MKYTRYYKCTLFVLIFCFFASCEECVIKELGTQPLPDGVVGFSYDALIDIDTECRPLLEEFFLVGGILPPGLSMYRDGSIRGTPTRKGNYHFTIVAEVCYSEDIFGYYDCLERSRGLSIRVD